jgi:hypothetical protein
MVTPTAARAKAAINRAADVAGRRNGVTTCNGVTGVRIVAGAGAGTTSPSSYAAGRPWRARLRSWPSSARVDAG